MIERSVALGASLISLVLALPGCDTPPAGCGSVGGRAGTCAIGEACLDSLDCESSNCAAQHCEESCSSASDCEAGEICISLHDGRGTRRACRSDCPSDPFHVVGDTGGLACVDGVLRACSELADPGPVCDLCRCAAGLRCVVPAGSECRTASTACSCVAPAPVGAPCTSNVGCLSFNCSGEPGGGARHCQIPAGVECDATSDCVHCDEPSEAGAPTCRQSCERDADCMGGACVPRTSGEPACYVDCTVDGHCPASQTCVVFEGDPRGRRYCAPSAP